MFRLRWMRDVPAQLWVIAGMLRGKKKGAFLRRVERQYRNRKQKRG
jgi:hypothetical protein